MTSRFDDIVYKITAESTLVDPGRLQRAFEEAAETGIPLLTLLVRGKDVQEAQIMKLIAREFNLEQVSLKGIAVDKKIAESVPYKFAAYYKFAPLSIENRILTIAVTVPLDIKIQDELRMHFGFDIRMVVAGEREIVDTLARVYGLGADTIEKINGSPHEDPALDPARADESALRDRVQDIEKLAEDASVIKLVNQILLEAYKKRATDIHIEPYRSEVKLRYRIDGVLYDANASPQIKKFIMPILSRIKIMSNLNIVERRLPQDGRAIVKTQDQMLDLRISFIPTPYGESVVIRILPASMIYDLNRIGLSAADQKVFEGLISKPHGIIFVTGPTGSGKSTTLYGALGRINKKERKIITIEDPIEYEMEGIVQIQVMPEIGLSFGRGLRAMLRHDPDIMMVGEVRDLETAEIAIRVALTGHLVFSTLHTNNAASGVTRLIDIGVEPYLVASSVEAFIAQRLVRVICPACKREDDKQAPELAAQIARELKLPGTDKVKFYRGQGCEECNFTGYHGRTGIFEILVMSEALKEMVLRKPSAEALKRLALSQGMKTLRQDGWEKVIRGVTTPEEIIDVTQEERHERIENSFFEEKVEAAPAGGKKDVDDDLPSYLNKRLFVRLNATVQIHWRICPTERSSEKKPVEELITMTKNVSAGGLLFLTKESLAAGAILELTIDLPDGAPVVCLARALRIEEVENATVYSVAVCFLDLSGADRSRLNRFVIRA